MGEVEPEFDLAGFRGVDVGRKIQFKLEVIRRVAVGPPLDGGRLESKLREAVGEVLPGHQLPLIGQIGGNFMFCTTIEGESGKGKLITQKVETARSTSSGVRPERISAKWAGSEDNGIRPM